MASISQMYDWVYRNGVYVAKSTVWRPETIPQEVLHSRLSRYGVSLIRDINRGLDIHNIPYEVGRFPELFDMDNFIVYTATSAIDTFLINSRGKRLTEEKRRLLLTRRVSKAVAYRLGNSKEVFEAMFSFEE